MTVQLMGITVVHELNLSHYVRGSFCRETSPLLAIQLDTLRKSPYVF